MRGPLFSLPTVMFLGALFFILIFFLFIFVQVGLITVAFSKLGLTPGQGFTLLIATLLGSGVNIPVFRSERLVPDVFVRKFRILNPQAPVEEPLQGKSLVHQTVAVNLGGCVIPVLLSMTLLASFGLNLPILLCIIIVSATTYALARPVPGVGIGIPVLIPPIITALAALIFVPGDIAPVAAYVAGSLGTLIGADLLHLATPATRKVLDAPVVSIGGAGTFDGIFITGILAVLLA
ncbi:DUF1614 domain-containing protein [Maridesulfovibrio ferrireducens]|uniref:DUF1614 domain-containing protein n=1 Tax=Maridesulfovibrio ferrireducens TaxID=246191 RepID=UPI001A3439CD|nr:DUF1614 domain-containing protein [Maridesulfovibrio ferrireducens]MBI9111503.1 DUF1614 domain-containing protein [Maridesulfovibrio ferrireducens]